MDGVVGPVPAHVNGVGSWYGAPGDILRLPGSTPEAGSWSDREGPAERGCRVTCSYCGADVEQGAAQCAHCEVAIVWKEGEAEFLSPGEFVGVMQLNDPSVTPVVESLLAANDIPYVIRGELSQEFLGWGRMSFGYNPVLGPPMLMVPGDRLEETRELLSEGETLPPPPDLPLEA
jgi:hypothetical protein